MAKKHKPQRNRRPWSTKDRMIVTNRAGNYTVAEVAKTLRRSAAAVQQWAMRNGISFRTA